MTPINQHPFKEQAALQLRAITILWWAIELGIGLSAVTALLLSGWSPPEKFFLGLAFMYFAIGRDLRGIQHSVSVALPSYLVDEIALALERTLTNARVNEEDTLPAAISRAITRDNVEIALGQNISRTALLILGKYAFLVAGGWIASEIIRKL